MQTITDIIQLRSLIAGWRAADHPIAFVPTMGNLHDGHMKLVRTAKHRALKVVVSIFVNPTQFGPHEDFDNYPRTEQQDAQKLVTADVDVLFLPSIDIMYPQRNLISIGINQLNQDYCGKSRPGHFEGMATIVCKLFNIVQPDMAFFGEKDFQQLAIIRQMVSDLNFPLLIYGVPTQREDDGLAMSSRNSYLTPQQRAVAPKLYQTLLTIKHHIVKGEPDFDQLTNQASAELNQAGFFTEYLNIANSDTLQPASPGDNTLIILAAAKLGNTRLIDNLTIHLNSA